jgi:hypothetical protein
LLPKSIVLIPLKAERERGERKWEAGVRDTIFTGNKKYVAFSGFEGFQAVVHSSF